MCFTGLSMALLVFHLAHHRRVCIVAVGQRRPRKGRNENGNWDVLVVVMLFSFWLRFQSVRRN